MAGGLDISVRSDLRATVVRLEAKAGSKQVGLAAMRALNRAAITVRKEASIQIRERYNLKARVIKAQMRIVKATSKRLVAEIVASGKRIDLIEFVVGRKQPGRRRGGVKARVTRQAVSYPHAFIAKMPSGYVGVFQRTGSFGRRGKSYLERIKKLVGISVPKAMAEKEVNKALAQVASRRFRTEFERELRFRLRA